MEITSQVSPDHLEGPEKLWKKKAETILVNLLVTYSCFLNQGIGGFCCLWAQCWLQHGPFHVGTDGGIQRCRTRPRKFKAKHVKVILSGQYPRLISALPPVCDFTMSMQSRYFYRPSVTTTNPISNLKWVVQLNCQRVRPILWIPTTPNIFNGLRK